MAGHACRLLVSLTGSGLEYLDVKLSKVSFSKWNRSQLTLLQKCESYQRAHSQITASIMVLYRNWANEVVTKQPNRYPNFERIIVNFIQKFGIDVKIKPQPSRRSAGVTNIAYGIHKGWLRAEVLTNEVNFIYLTVAARVTLKMCNVILGWALIWPQRAKWANVMWLDRYSFKSSTCIWKINEGIWRHIVLLIYTIAAQHNQCQVKKWWSIFKLLCYRIFKIIWSLLVIAAGSIVQLIEKQ